MTFSSRSSWTDNRDWVSFIIFLSFLISFSLSTSSSKTQSISNLSSRSWKDFYSYDLKNSFIRLLKDCTQVRHKSWSNEAKRCLDSFLTALKSVFKSSINSCDFSSCVVLSKWLTYNRERTLKDQWKSSRVRQRSDDIDLMSSHRKVSLTSRKFIIFVLRIRRKRWFATFFIRLDHQMSISSMRLFLTLRFNESFEVSWMYSSEIFIAQQQNSLSTLNAVSNFQSVAIDHFINHFCWITKFFFKRWSITMTRNLTRLLNNVEETLSL